MVCWDSTTDGTADGSATVTVVTAGLSVEEIGQITRAFTDVAVVSVAEALRAPLPRHTVIAARDSAQVAELLTRFGQSAAAPPFHYALPAEPDPGLSQALGPFDVMSIEPRDEALVLRLRRAGELPGTASGWVRRLSVVTSKSDGDGRLNRAAGGSHEPAAERVAGTRSTDVAKPLSHSRGGMRAQLKPRLDRRTVGLIGGSVLVAILGACGLFAFRNVAGMLLAASFGFLLAACTAGVFSVRQRLETVARRVQDVAAASDPPGKPSKSIEAQLRSLRSAVSVNTSTVGSSTAAVNELVQKLHRAAPEDTPRVG